MDFSADDITAVLQEMDAALVTKALSVPHGGPAARTELLEACLRALSLKDKPGAFLSHHFKREILFWLITGSGGGQWVKNALDVQQAGVIYEANAWIRRNYKDAFSVAELSARWHMSVSRFQRLFKTAVGMGVIQCRTKLRLNEARRLMSEENFNVTQAALEVGYESVSQFIREYKKLFGVPPRRDVAKK